ncbi:MAG: PilZ domain-containing protein [Bryobacteraceae bacterium]
MNRPVDLSLEQRREIRRPADGDVRLSTDAPSPVEIEGRLIDVSCGGFRVAHDCYDLGLGQTVRFQHTAGSGVARVIWNRILDRRVETGFLIL